MEFPGREIEHDLGNAQHRAMFRGAKGGGGGGAMPLPLPEQPLQWPACNSATPTSALQLNLD